MFLNFYIKNKETIHNFLWKVVQTFGKQGVTFIIFLISANLLIPEEFGLYSYVMAVIFLLAIFGDFGISIATSKYVAEYNSLDSDKDKVKKVLSNSFLVILLLSSIVSILVIIFGKLIVGNNIVYVYWLLPMLIFSPLTSMVDGIYRGLKKFRLISIITLVLGICSLFWFYLLIKNFGIIGALISQNIFYISLTILSVVFLKEKSFSFDKKIIKSITSYSIYVGLASLGYYLFTKVDVLILGHFNYINEIGYYEIVNKIFVIVILPVSILASVVAPNTTKNYALKRLPYLKNKMLKEGLFLFFVGLFLSIIMYFMLPYIFKVFFADYDQGVISQIMNLLLILVPLRFFSTYFSLGYITPSGNVKIITTVLFVFGSLNVLLDFIFINIFGFIGVIYVTVIVQILLIITKDIWFVSRLKKLSNNNK